MGRRALDLEERKMSEHVIVGAGAVGSAAALLLAERGEHVRIITRHGSGPEHPAVERVAADATDAERLTSLTTGAAALYNCASPQYHQWFTDWPPLAAAFLTAAERTGAVLVSMSNLYGYGPVDGPISQKTPIAATHPKLLLRARMWDDQLAAQRDGRIRTTEVRASDYIEANGLLSFALGKPILAGKRAYSPAPLNVPHSWTSVHDCAQTLVTVAADERAYGQVWMVPTNPALTVRQLASRFAEVNGARPAKVTVIPYPVTWATGLFMPMVKELRTTRYQFTRPFVIDASATTETFGLQPILLDDALRDAAARLRA
jgi:nucleoside-diphosphate-sugar epimerase